MSLALPYSPSKVVFFFYRVQNEEDEVPEKMVHYIKQGFRYRMQKQEFLRQIPCNGVKYVKQNEN